MSASMQAQRLGVAMNLDDLPELVLRHLGSFLDSADVIALTRVNRKLRKNLIVNPVWTDLLDRMQVELPTPFDEVLCRCDECTLHKSGKTVHALLNLRLCQECANSEKYDFITKARGIELYFVKEQNFENLRKVSGEGEGGEDFYLRADVKAQGEANEARLTGALFGSLFEQFQQQTGGALVGWQSGNTFFMGPNPMLFANENDAD